MDKRQSTRYEVSLNALVHPKVGRSWLCQIRDFCDAGMLLAEQNGRPRRSLPGITAGETVGIHFSLPVDGKDQHFRLEGKIVRLMEHGVGINFPSGMDEEAFTMMSEHSGMQPVPDGEPAANDAASSGSATDLPSAESVFERSGLKPDDTKRIVALLRKEVVQVLPQMSAELFKFMDEELLELAKNSKSNAEQSEYFAAMSSLEKAKKGVIQSVENAVLEQIDHPRELQTLLDERKKAADERKAQAQSKVKLSLVNTEEFEDWLAVANIVSRTERMYEKLLRELTIRMGMLVDSWSHLGANPLGVAVITHAFDSAVQNLELDQSTRQLVYTGYEKTVLPLFRNLYTNATKQLEDSGVFPEIDDDYISPSKPVVKEEEKPAKEEAAEEVEEEIEEELEEDEGDEEEAKRPSRSSRRRSSRRSGSGGGAAGGREGEHDDGDVEEEEPREASSGSRRRSSRRRRSTDAGEDRSVEVSGEQSPPRRRRRADNVGEAIRNIYESVKQLVGPQAGVDDYEGYEGEFFENDEVQDLLSALEDEAITTTDRRMPVRQRLAETASLMGGKKVAPGIMQNLEVVENLVDTIEEDPLLSGNSKNWIRQLELTLDKVAAERDDFLNEKDPHQALEVVNQLANLGSIESGNAKRVVDEIIEDINNNYSEDPQVIDRAREKLQPLVERQNRAFTGNVQRTVKASQGQQTLHNAQRAVVSEMDDRYAGKEVPEILFRLLMPGWRNLLVNTHLRQGLDSADWKKHVRALDQVFQYLDPESDPSSSPGYMEPQELIEHIEEGLDSISYEPGQRIPLVNSLRQVISGEEGAVDLPMVALQGNTVAEQIGFANINADVEVREQIREENANDLQWQRFYDRAHRLHVGAWAEFEMGDRENEISIVAWVNDDATRLVFVNRRGVKTHDLSVEQLANMMKEGKVKILDESEIPLTDRASHRMLQNMHNQLTHQATHDDLTGLLNRKEFERELTIALEDARKTDSQHLCAHLDLDQFKVINNAGGHEAGDQLLVTISNILRERLEGQNAKIARLSGDEFGLLVCEVKPEIGITLMKSITDAIKEIRFEWGSDVFSLTVSCGVFNMQSDTESVSKVMSGADEACLAAKEAGRDRILEYSEDDSEMAHRKDIMEFVSHIDKALAEDRFVLNCQKIQPIDPTDPDVHYEILLTILDEDDNALPPQDFIIAAERYNRMGAVDRWVIRNSFKFIAANILKLEDLGVFSINLSGNSLTEPDFMEFVLEQFNETRLPTSMICFEITETAAVGNLDDVVDFIEKLKIAGVQFSLDDFGTGLSSYSYLRTLPVDYLKIDGIFVKDIKDNPSDYAVVKSINEIGHFMGKKTIAEYCEDEEIIEILREIGVDYAQGWGVGMKIPVTEFLASL